MRLTPMLALAALLATPAVAAAEDCASMSLFRQGAHQVRTSYNAKGKETGTASLDVLSVSTAGAVTTATARSVTTSKGKETGAVDFTMTCEGGEYRVDMRAMVPSESTEAYKDFTLTLEGGDLGYPSALAAGLALPDASMTMTFTMAGAPAMIPPTTMIYTASNRVVVGPEPITTPAGAFSTWKITYDSTVDMKGMVKVTTVTNATEWYVPGLGAVKSEVWSRGNLEGTTVLTENR